MADLQRKTANLFDYNTVTFGKYIDSKGNEQVSNGTGEQSLNHSDYIAINAGITYAFKCDKSPIDSATFNAFCWFDSNKQFVKRETFDAGAVDPYILGTAAAPINAAYLIMNYRGLHGDTAMLNTGSNHLPYEPYGWQHSLRKLTTATDTLTTLPVDVYADSNNATVGLKGNTVQNGTPTPTTPIMPQGTGERTGNLLLSNWEQGAIDSSGTDIPSANGVRTKNYIPVTPNTIYSISRNITTSYINLRFYNSNKQYINYGTSSNIRLISGNSEANPMTVGMGFCCFEIIDTNIKYMRINDNSNDTSTKYMMVEGQYTASTMPAYEPYGYKIPISSASTTTPVYLGEVETTRKVKKLVLTGKESWDGAGTSGHTFRLEISDVQPPSSQIVVCDACCTHYTATSFSKVYNANTTGFGIPSTAKWIAFCDLSISGYTNFAAYLAAQYAAGTPVTVWYVLATEETGIVNEPLCKIGNYADEVSDVSIPVTTGGDTLSVGTTVQPSEVTVNYTGWHDATVKEWDGSQWNE